MKGDGKIVTGPDGAVHDVWEKARPDEAYAEINFFADRFSIASGGRHVERYTRALPKTIEQEVIDEFFKPSADNILIAAVVAREKARAMLEAYAARTGGKE